MKTDYSKSFLTNAGYVLIAGALLGLIGVLGPTAQQSIFGASLWMSYSVSLIYLVVGAAALFSAYVLPASVNMTLSFAIGTAAFFAGLYGLVWSSKILGIHLEGWLGNLFNLGIGIWGIRAVSGERFKLIKMCRMGDTNACNMLKM